MLTYDLVVVRCECRAMLRLAQGAYRHFALALSRARAAAEKIRGERGSRLS